MYAITEPPIYPNVVAIVSIRCLTASDGAHEGNSGIYPKLNVPISALKKSGLTQNNLDDLIEFNFEKEKEKYNQNDVNRLSAFAYFYNLGLSAKNFSLLKSLSERGIGFFESNNSFIDIDEQDLEIAINKFALIIGSYILEDL